MSKNSVNLEERILPTAVGFDSDSDGNEELGVQPYLYDPEPNTEGNANITVLFYEITERVESKFWSFENKNQNKRRHNEKGWMMLCLDIKSDTMWKITACFHAVNTETVSMVWTCRFARKWLGYAWEYYYTKTKVLNQHW